MPKTANAAANPANGVGTAITGSAPAWIMSPSASAARLPKRTATRLASTDPAAAARATPSTSIDTTVSSTSWRALRAGSDVTTTA
jgi:hypothetical protein